MFFYSVLFFFKHYFHTSNTTVPPYVFQGTVVKLEDTSAKLLGILSEDSFESGKHIDFYDSGWGIYILIFEIINGI